jgi:hypothetical protein
LPGRPSHTSLQTAHEWSFTTPNSSSSNSNNRDLDRDLSMKRPHLFRPRPLVLLAAMATISLIPYETEMAKTRREDLASTNATCLLFQR